MVAFGSVPAGASATTSWTSGETSAPARPVVADCEASVVVKRVSPVASEAAQALKKPGRTCALSWSESVWSTVSSSCFTTGTLPREASGISPTSPAMRRPEPVAGSFTYTGTDREVTRPVDSLTWMPR